jgi:hypothetical protein
MTITSLSKALCHCLSQATAFDRESGVKQMQIGAPLRTSTDRTSMVLTIEIMRLAVS